MKKVLLMVIDALANRVIEPALAAGRLPNFQKLVTAGGHRPQCTSIFPSITPAATCSIATGCYPRDTGIAGAYWYDGSKDEVAYFGDDIWPILEKGVSGFIHDFQMELNHQRLRVPTIFELLYQRGNSSSACLNYMWFRGNVAHKAHTPLLLKFVPGISTDGEMQGPPILCMGDFVTTTLKTGEVLKARGGLSRRCGFHDETTADYLLQLAKAGPMPDFTLAYFPNNDFESHKVGPEEAESTLQAIDAHFEKLFEVFGGASQMLEQLAVLITGDHSQSDIVLNDPGINLDEVLSEFELVSAGDTWDSDDDVMACPNMRAAEIYLRNRSDDLRDAVCDRLLANDGVDQVIWRTCQTTYSHNQHWQFHVATADRGKLIIWQTSGDGALGADIYGGQWAWEGDLQAVDAVLENGTIGFRDYPNAFERIASAFFDNSGELIATARLGREFRLPDTSVHAAGSHGSLHALDSSAPLIFAGLPKDISVPENPRTVDVVPICMSTLGLTPPQPAGSSHCRTSTPD